MKKIHIMLLLVLLIIITITSCSSVDEFNEPKIKTLTETEYEDLKEKPFEELTEEEQVQVSNYEELVLAKANRNLPMEYLNYVEENYYARDTDINNAIMFTNGNISVAIFYEYNSIGIYGDKSQKEEIENELELVLSYYDSDTDDTYDENFLDKLMENKNDYLYTTYGDTEIRGLYSKEGYDIFVNDNDVSFLVSTKHTTQSDLTYLNSSNSAIKNDDDWNLILVNKWNYMPNDYKVTLTKLRNNQAVDERIYPELQEMFDSARRNNIYPLVVSSYRTFEEQQELMNNQINEYKKQGYSISKAKQLAENRVAIPGTSEHQIGLAVDINAETEESTKEEVNQWLYENSYKFGFILRYPDNKTDITGINYEPWHYRYVGKEGAKEIYEQGLCLEEYIENLNKVK